MRVLLELRLLFRHGVLQGNASSTAGGPAELFVCAPLHACSCLHAPLPYDYRTYVLNDKKGAAGKPSAADALVGLSAVVG